jgi:hypothetical protein
MDIGSGMEMEKPSPLHRSLSTVTYWSVSTLD